jgi:crossover junction endodeoxyribonuclease RuvC
MRYICAADPGINGAIAIYDVLFNTLRVFAMPMIEETVMIKGKKKTRKIYDLKTLRDSLLFTPNEVFGFFLEKVGVLPNQGIVSSGRFMWGAGAVESMMITKNYDVTLVRPQKWKAVMGLIGSEKDDSRAKATELFPECAPYWKLKKHDGLAEAALIMAWGAKELGITLENVLPGNTFITKTVRKKKNT